MVGVGEGFTCLVNLLTYIVYANEIYLMGEVHQKLYYVMAAYIPSPYF